MNLVVLPQAADEFEDAAAHHADKQPGLGQRFREEVDRHIQWIAQHAEIPRLRPGGYRRVNLNVVFSGMKNDLKAAAGITLVDFRRVMAK